MDTLTPEQRSERMSRVKGRDTVPELAVRRVATALGYRYRLNRRDVPGHPDLVFVGLKRVVFVHGCFWHRHPKCPRTRIPKSRSEFWKDKFRRNVERDKVVRQQLRTQGWRFLVIWECQSEREELLVGTLRRFLGGSS